MTTSDEDLRKIINAHRQPITSGSPISVYVSAAEICQELLDAHVRIAELEAELAAIHGVHAPADYRFRPGQAVFAIVLTAHRYPCFVCDSAGIVTIKKHSFPCPKCGGFKEIWGDKWLVNKREVTITEVKETGAGYEYRTNLDPNGDTQISLHATRAEATEEANKRNEYIEQKLRKEHDEAYGKSEG